MNSKLTTLIDSTKMSKQTSVGGYWPTPSLSAAATQGGNVHFNNICERGSDRGEVLEGRLSKM